MLRKIPYCCETASNRLSLMELHYWPIKARGYPSEAHVHNDVMFWNDRDHPAAPPPASSTVAVIAKAGGLDLTWKQDSNIQADKDAGILAFGQVRINLTLLFPLHAF